jgi:hypothetical protein
MIITKLQGGIGNQLFQWAYGKYLSVKYQTPLYLDLDYYINVNKIDTKREFSFDKFSNLEYNILPNKNISSWSTENKYRIQTLNDNFIFSELNYDYDSHYFLNGYWQSEKYFSSISHLIKDNLKPNSSVIDKLSQRYPIDKNCVSLHIRRTDYVTSNGYHPVQSIEYYQKALEIVGSYDHLLVFSDDIKWCKENLNFENMIFVEGNDDVEDLWLMSMCKNNIIANSSFSWWGAWLNSNVNKKVVAPENWFGDQTNLDYSDIIPQSWIKI